MSGYQSSGKLEDASSGRVKLMCSYGGKILPRPHDNELRYVGGETRVLYIDRSIRFLDLMSKLARFYGNVLVFKYQLPGEDLDALVSVLNDEDLEMMMEEFDRLQSNAKFSRIRSFLFHLKQSSFPETVEEARDPEQRFLNAINEMPSVSRRQMILATDSLFGLDGLANQGGNSAALRGKPVTLLSTSPALQNLPSDIESTYPSHSMASSQRVDLLYRPQTSSNQHQVMLNATSATEKRVFCSSVATTESHSLSSYKDFRSGTRETYVPLVEVPRDQPKGMVLKQSSVKDSLPISSFGSPRLKLNTGTLDDFSGMSEQSLEEQLDAYACFTEINRLPETEEKISGFNKNTSDFENSVVSSGLRRLPFSDQRLNLLHQINAHDHYRVPRYVSAGGSKADLCSHHQHRRTEDVVYQNIEASSREYGNSENDVGKKLTMKRIASDPMLSSQHSRQEMHSLAYSSNRTSEAIPWQTNDHQRQQHHEVDGSLPPHMVFLPKPQSSVRPMHRVASVPNIVKAGADSLPPRYVAAPHAPPSFTQHHDKHSSIPQHAPSTIRSFLSTHPSPSRLR